MPIEYVYSSDDSEFSETDMSIRGRNGRTHVRRRSVSRHQRHPEVKEYLAPAPQTRVHRSASTGGHRRDRDSTPAVMIINEQATRASNAASSKPKTRVEQKYYDESDSEEEALRRKHNHSRHRAASGVSANVNVTAPRTPSPYHRDYELVMNQRLLEKSDFKQDMEIWKQQQEIEKLEKELEKAREKPERGSRLLREEEEWYEDEISERLRRLQRYERRSKDEDSSKKAEKAWRLKHLEEEQREEEAARKAEKSWRLRKLEETEKAEEAQRKAERQWRMKRLEEAEKEAAEKEEVRERIKKEKLEEIARQQEEDAEREKLKKEILEEERRKLFEAEEKRKKEMALKAAAVEEWKLEQERAKAKAAEEAAKRDHEFRERLRHDLGYSEEEIAHMLNKKKRNEEKEEKKEKQKEIEEQKTTWIKVHRKHLLPETLLAYNLPWDWDEHDSNYIIIKRWVTEDFQEELFSHTKRIREGKMVAQTSHSQTTLKVNDSGKDRMYLVRKKSPQHKLRIFAS